MAFLQSFLTTLLEAVIIAAVAAGGIFLGKHLREKKNEKEANTNEEIAGGKDSE